MLISIAIWMHNLSNICNVYIYIDHMPCLNEDCVKEVGGDAWFCGEKCQEVC